ncbi:MAG: DEAD/DEAH box helicase [Treponema sp.]|jgi:ATP-dependent RNA helicase DeaD|nr:DEAD/DEAH box helicase [Treponema sp.]
MLADETLPFSSFGLSGAVLDALIHKGFEKPTSIQSIALPRLMAETGHLIVKARTGTGKTAAFGIPLVERITTRSHKPQALILTPTRELALQVSREIGSFIPAGEARPPDGPPRNFPRITAVYGGASIRNQILDLKRGTEVVVGTPGRVMDLMDRKILDLSGVDWFILDEADEMLDMGFFEDVETIMLKTGRGASAEPPAADAGAGAEAARETTGTRAGRTAPLPYRVALFSATMPEAILNVVKKHIGDADILEDTAPDEGGPGTSLLIDQFYMILKREDRLEALRRIIDGTEDFYGLIFCRTKIETDELARRLVENGYSAEAIHGDLSQEARERTLRRFRSKQTTIMVATDVAARGLDIERLTHVVNWDLPHDRETYVHRIGRTGRAGRKGKAVTLALPSERGRISQLSRSMERVLGSGISWMKVPSVKSVMKTLRARIVSDVLAGLPELPPEPAAETPVTVAETAAETPVAETTAEPVETTEPAAEVLPEPVAEAAPGAAETAGTTAVTEPAAAHSAGTESPAGGDESAAAGQETASPFLTKVCRSLIERLGAEKALEALITVHYGELLDPSRYAPVTEFTEILPPRPVRGAAGSRGGFFQDGERAGPGTHSRRNASYEGRPSRERGPAGPGREARGPGRKRNFSGEEALSNTARVYVGLGRQHGASARDVATLLVRAGGVPARLVDAIEMKDYCAFASLPEEAARRACVFSHNAPDTPPIKFAKPKFG